MPNVKAYETAQIGMSHLKSAVFRLLAESGDKGLRNVDIGVGLGIYSGHKGHEGHIPRTILAIMEQEGTVKQDKEKLWYLVEK